MHSLLPLPQIARSPLGLGSLPAPLPSVHGHITLLHMAKPPAPSPHSAYLTNYLPTHTKSYEIHELRNHFSKVTDVIGTVTTPFTGVPATLRCQGSLVLTFKMFAAVFLSPESTFSKKANTINYRQLLDKSIVHTDEIILDDIVQADIKSWNEQVSNDVGKRMLNKWKCFWQP